MQQKQFWLKKKQLLDTESDLASASKTPRIKGVSGYESTVALANSYYIARDQVSGF